MYWTDSETKRIEVASLEKNRFTGGMDRKVLVWAELDLPRAIALAPEDGLMFWSDWGQIPKIEATSMDGDPASRVTLVDSDIGWPNGITLDHDSKTLFWVDAKTHQISSVDWRSGRNRRVVLGTEDALPQPFAVSFFRGALYWSDWTTRSLHMYNASHVDPLASPQKIRLRGSKLDPMDMKVFEPSRQLLGSNGTSPFDPCEDNPCSHLCLLASGAPGGYRCACNTGILLADEATCRDEFTSVLLLAKRDDIRKISLDMPDFTDIVVEMDYGDRGDNTSAGEARSSIAVGYDPVDRLVYWTDQFSGIHRATLDGKGAEGFIVKEVDHPDGVYVDYLGRNLYWTDTFYDRIEVARLDDPENRKVLISRGLDEPRALVLDPSAGLMFWSDWGDAARIERAWMDGSHRGVIVDTDIGWPNGMAIDVQEKKVYWCDAKTDRIEVCDYDGSGRRVVLDDVLPHPFGLTLLGDYLYWTDWHEHVVQRADKVSREWTNYQF